MSGAQSYALMPRGGDKGQKLVKASAADFDGAWVDDVRLILSGVTGADGAKTFTFAPPLAFDPAAVGLTLFSAQPARVRVAALTRASCRVMVEADPAAAAVAGVKVLSAASDQPVANATVTLEIVQAPTAS